MPIAPKKITALTARETHADDDAVPGIHTGAATPAAKNIFFSKGGFATWILAKVANASEAEAADPTGTENRWWSAVRVAEVAAAVIAASASGLANNWAAARAPLGTDDETVGGGGYAQGSLWRWSLRVWICVDASTNIASWVEITAGFGNPMTTAGDVIVGGEDGAPTRLAKGSDGQILKMVSGMIAWAAETVGLTNPMTTAGDTIVGGEDGAPARLAVGSDGQVLKVVSGAPVWAAESGGGGANTLYSERSYGGGSAVIEGGHFMVARTAMTLARVDAEVEDGGSGDPEITLQKNGSIVATLGITGAASSGNRKRGSIAIEGEGVSVEAGDILAVVVSNTGEYMSSGAATGALVVGLEWARA